MPKNIDLLPRLEETEFVVSRPAPDSDRFINLNLQTTDKVRFQDTDEATARHIEFSAMCSNEDTPEAFEILRNAPLGSHVKVSGYWTSRSAQVAGQGGRSYRQPLAQLKITDAKITSVIQPVDQTV